MTVGIGPTANQLASVSQGQWQDYLANFVPMENQAIQFAMDPNAAATAMSEAAGIQTQAQAQAPGIASRRLAQFDTQLTPDQQAAQSRQSTISNNLATVGAENQAKDVTVAEQMGIMGAPMTGITGAA